MVCIFLEYFGFILTLIYVGLLNDPTALAAVGIANMIMTMASISICFGLNTALDTFVS